MRRWPVVYLVVEVVRGLGKVFHYIDGYRPTEHDLSKRVMELGGKFAARLGNTGIIMGRKTMDDYFQQALFDYLSGDDHEHRLDDDNVGVFYLRLDKAHQLMRQERYQGTQWNAELRRAIEADQNRRLYRGFILMSSREASDLVLKEAGHYLALHGFQVKEPGQYPNSRAFRAGIRRLGAELLKLYELPPQSLAWDFVLDRDLRGRPSRPYGAPSGE